MLNVEELNDEEESLKSEGSKREGQCENVQNCSIFLVWDIKSDEVTTLIWPLD